MYPAGVTSKGDQFSIRLNIVVDERVGMARSASTGSITQHFYPEIGVMVNLQNNRFICGGICRWVTEEIN